MNKKINYKLNNLFLYDYLHYFPDEIIEIIMYHLQALIIQNIFKLNRPLTNFECGDRVLILNSNCEVSNRRRNNLAFLNSIKNKIYGTIVSNYNNSSNYITIKLLPRIIPNWKKCNINFWKNFQTYINNSISFNFPYYTPKSIKVNKNKIIKLNQWNDEFKNINNLDTSNRIQMYYNHCKNNRLNSDVLNSGITNKNNMFGYLF